MIILLKLNLLANIFFYNYKFLQIFIILKKIIEILIKIIN